MRSSSGFIRCFARQGSVDGDGRAKVFNADSLARRSCTPDHRRPPFDGLHGEAGLAPRLEPATQRMHIVEADLVRTKGDPGARCLSGLRTVENKLAVSWDRVVGMPQLFGINQASPRDLVRSGLEVERRSQVHDHRTVARLQPSLEFCRGDASFPEMTKEAMPPDVLEHEV